jgi:rhamnogalacturonyl hydrolase YesR
MSNYKILLVIASIVVILFNLNGCSTSEFNLPEDLKPFIDEIVIDDINNTKPVTKITGEGDFYKVNITFNLQNEVQQDDWQVKIKPGFLPAFNWAPHLTPASNNIIDQHVFRSPALIVSDENQVLVILPDISLLMTDKPVRWYMDMDAEQNLLTLGMSNSKVTEHVLFEKDNGAKYPEGKIAFGFYIYVSTKKEDIENPFRKPLDFLWTKFGNPQYKKGNPLKGNLRPYVDYTYNWAFNSWKNSVWQEFFLKGKKVGAPVFIVNTTQSPNYPGEINEREFRSIWNQAWFNSLRSAGGVYRYAKRTGDKDLLEKALITKELALSFPRNNGFFYGLIGTEMEQVTIDGKPYNRSKGWNTYYWGNSNRNPYSRDPSRSPFHILDMSWTALLMLRWYEELEADERLLNYAKLYGDALVAIQDEKGYFPAWLDIETLQPMDYLNDSPETSMSVTFLLKLAQLTKNEKYKVSAVKAMNRIVENIIPVGRWEDFETYWSCCRVGTPQWVGKKIERNNMYKQCNFSMFWTSEALYECYLETKDEKYLKLGQRTLDELLMTQASWQPYFIYVNGLGGFGVMNSDGEWNDSRGSLFAELIIQYGKLLNNEEYIERGKAALRASVVMMYCPDNPATKVQWEKVWPFFGKEDYGFMMENYGHEGRTSPEGKGMGEFTIYDWGNGAASEAINRIADKFGEDFIDY